MGTLWVHLILGVDSFLICSLGSIDCPIHVLYVVDEEGFLSTTKQILELKGLFQVETALAPDEALQKLEQNQFDVIVSDYQMPSKDGLTFLNELREQGISIPFILFTGKGREEVAIKALNLGADYYISKSGQPETVYSQLSHFILQAVRKKKAEERLKYKLEFESVIARVSSRFVNYTNFNETINDSLADIGLISGASHVYIYLFQENGSVLNHLHTWTADNSPYEPEKISPITPVMIPWGIKRLRTGQTILINDVERLPPEAESEKEFLKIRNVKSIVVLPIKVFGTFAGFIGFDNIHKTEAWNSDDVSLLKIVSELIGTTLERKKSEELYRTVFENTGTAMCIIEDDMTISKVNRRFEELTGYAQDVLK